MKLLFDFITIALFFIVYKWHSIFAAVAVAMLAYTTQVAYLWLRYRTVEKIQLVTLALIIVLGGATLVFHNETFFFWKPTAVYWLFAVAFFASHRIGEKTIAQRMMEHAITLPAPVWSKVNVSWAIFFSLLGCLNLYVAFNYDLDTWVNFKLFGMLALTFVFVIVQALYIAKHVQHEQQQSSNKS